MAKSRRPTSAWGLPCRIRAIRGGEQGSVTVTHGVTTGNGQVGACQRQWAVGQPIFQAGYAVPSLHDFLGHVRRVKAKPLRGRFASLDTAAMARGIAAIEATREEQGTAAVQVSPGPIVPLACH